MKFLLYKLILLIIALRPGIVQTGISVLDDKGVEIVFVPSGQVKMGASLDDAITFCKLVYPDAVPSPCSEAGFSVLYSFKDIEFVTVQDFYMDRYEVSVEKYLECLEADVCTVWAVEHEFYALLEDPELPIGVLPVSGINYYDAAIYCAWREGRLPTEAEWQYAAVGSTEYSFPWGDKIDDISANYCDTTCSPRTSIQFDDGFAERAPVDAYEAGQSWSGIYNLSGNVAEWTSTRFLVSEGANPIINTHIVKGGSYQSGIHELTTWLRIPTDTLKPFASTGFRCVRTTDPHPES